MKLYIVGNGFDLHHGIQSKYSDFDCFLECHDPNIYEVVNKYLGNTEYFWSSFEQNLAYLDEDKILAHASNYLVDYGADDWSDAFHHDYQYEIDLIISPLTNGLRRNFIEWVLQLKIEHTKNRMLDLKRESLFLNFNYTQTLEKLYQIESSNINYIHGKAVDSNSNLIFGHNYIKPNDKLNLEKIRKELGEDAYHEYLDELGSDDIRVVEGADILNSYFESTRKPIDIVIEYNKYFWLKLQAIDEIFILGHSLEEIDTPYFEKVFSSIDNSNVKWTVSYYKKEEIIKHRQVLVNLGVKENLINIVAMDYFYPTKGVLFT